MSAALGGITPAPGVTVISGGRTLPATTGGEGVTPTADLIPITIVITDGIVSEVATGPDAARLEATYTEPTRSGAALTVKNVAGALITPGLVDVHIHLREPGQEAKETIATGTAAAARGGWTSVCAMPNTVPDPHTPELLGAVQERITTSAQVRVYPFSPITVGLRSNQLVDLPAQVTAGAIGFSNDGFGVQEAGTMMAAMAQAAALDVPIATHSEDESIKRDGVINAGVAAKNFDLPGIHRLAEIVQVARDTVIAEATGAHLHLCHASTREAIDIARQAQARGVNVTVEATPHHLLLVDEQIPADDASWKMNPPLRTPTDAQALVAGLNDGTITVIATDNAPHLEGEKHCSFRDGAFGIVSNEYAFALLYTQLVKTGLIGLETLVAALTTGPASAYHLNAGRIEVGAPADIAAFDLGREVTIDPDRFVGKARNCPFAGASVHGDCVLTVCGGHIVHDSTTNS